MRLVHRCALAVAAAAVVSSLVVAHAQDKQGGIQVPGWQGKIDPQEEKAGQTLSNATLAPGPGGALDVAAGPAVTFWNPKNVAKGNYTVKATFTESDPPGDHPHPYGIVIAGNEMGTPQQSYLYCAAYANGTFIVRGFGPEPFQMGGRRPTPHDAVSKTDGKGSPVTQEIAVSVTADAVSCAINGQVVASYPKSELVAAGKLRSTDGVYGIRFGRSAKAVVSGLTVTTP